MPGPIHGVLKLPSAVEGNVGAALVKLQTHVEWVISTQLQAPLLGLSYEGLLIATGGENTVDELGRVQKKQGFRTSPQAQKMLIALATHIEFIGALLEVPVKPVHNASWRSLCLGPQRRGTDRTAWKALSVAWAKEMGWFPKNDNDADALGQLTHRLHTAGVPYPWRDRLLLGGGRRFI